LGHDRSDIQNSEGSLIGSPTDVFPLRVYDFDISPDSRRLLGVAVPARQPLGNSGQVNSSGINRNASTLDLSAGNGEKGYREPTFRTVVYDVMTMEEIPSVSSSLPCLCISVMLMRLMSSSGHHPSMSGEVTNFKLAKDGKSALISRNPNVSRLSLFRSITDCRILLIPRSFLIASE
jgi:hypothetical protein